MPADRPTQQQMKMVLALAVVRKRGAEAMKTGAAVTEVAAQINDADLKLLVAGGCHSTLETWSLQAIFKSIATGNASSGDVSDEMMSIFQQASEDEEVPADRPTQQRMKMVLALAVVRKRGQLMYEAATECTDEIKAMFQSAMDAGTPWDIACGGETSLDGGEWTPVIVRRAISNRADCELIYVLTQTGASAGAMGLATASAGGKLPADLVEVGIELFGLSVDEIAYGFSEAENAAGWTTTVGACTFSVGFAGPRFDKSSFNYVDATHLDRQSGAEDDSDDDEISAM